MEDQQKRLFLALLMCAGAAVLWQMLVMSPPPEPTEGTGQVAQATQGSETGGQAATGETPAQTTAQPEATPGTGAGGTGAGTGQAVAEPQSLTPEPMTGVAVLPPQHFVGSRFTAGFTNAGGTLSNHAITAPEQYIPRDTFGGVFPNGGEHLPDFELLIEGLPLLMPQSTFELVEDESEVADREVFAEAYEAHEAAAEEGDDAGPLYQRLVYRWTDGETQVDKIFTADPERDYVLGLDVQVTDLSGRGRALGDIAIRMWADASQSESGGVFNPIANTLEAACFVDADLETEGLGDAAGQVFAGPTEWAGVMDRYFLAAVAVTGEQRAQGCEFSADGERLASVLVVGDVTLGPSESQSLSFVGYVGPKAADQLGAAGSNLGRSVEYGIFGFLAKPMRWVLTSFFSFIPNWGVAIILLTIVVKLLLFPLTHKAFKSMEGMREIQPKLVELREKFKNDRAKLTEETMKLYREHNVNPLGCLPMFLQMPIYIALYRTIYSSVELYKADFALWITDLSEPDPFYILPVLMAITMLGQQLLMPTTIDNPQMKWVMRLMPVMFGVFMLVLPSGLVLYIFISSLLGILQQWYIRRGRKERQAETEEVKEPAQLTRQQRRQRARRQKT